MEYEEEYEPPPSPAAEDVSLLAVQALSQRLAAVQEELARATIESEHRWATLGIGQVCVSRPTAAGHGGATFPPHFNRPVPQAQLPAALQPRCSLGGAP